MKKDAETTKKEIEEINKAIYELDASVKIIGELDQDRNLTISERETLPEAVERQRKKNELLARVMELTGLLEEA